MNKDYATVCDPRSKEQLVKLILAGIDKTAAMKMRS